MNQIAEAPAPAADPQAVSTTATLCEAFQRTVNRFPTGDALRHLGDAQALTWRQYAERVRRIAGGLAQLGVGRGDTVALMLTNRAEFNLVDMAAAHLGAIPFSVYNTSSPEQIAHQFANAENRVVITERRFEATVRAVGAPSLESVLVLEDGLPDADHPDFEAAWRAVRPDDVATLIYTSGTTGPPKGVQLSHRNLISAMEGLLAAVPFRDGGRFVSYLPAAHLGDRFMAHYCAIVTGSAITSVGWPTGLGAGLLDARPTGLLSVPRMLEKMKAALEVNGAREPTSMSEEERAVVRAQVGLDQADWIISGSAPISPEVLEYFRALGLPIVEGWGMSETGCCGTINPMDDVRVGTVGKPMRGVEVRVANDGEFLVRGANVMIGYRNDPEETAEAIDADGWLHTGDIAQIDSDGYVRIVDRKKDVIINAAGKNMAPANIEQVLKAASPLIGQTIAIGDRRPYNVALIVLDPDAAAAHAHDHGLGDVSTAALASAPSIHDAITGAVERANERLSRVEQIKRFAVLPVEWVPDGDELTPTMKLKRRAIAAKYSNEIDALYQR